MRKHQPFLCLNSRVLPNRLFSFNANNDRCVTIWSKVFKWSQSVPDSIICDMKTRIQELNSISPILEWLYKKEFQWAKERAQWQKGPLHLGSTNCRSIKLFSIESLDLRFSNGVERTYERMKPSGCNAVMMVPIEQGDILLVREAAGTERYELGFPKGLDWSRWTAKWSRGSELKEEIGFGANKLTPLKEVILAPLISLAKWHCLSQKNSTSREARRWWARATRHCPAICFRKPKNC